MAPSTAPASAAGIESLPGQQGPAASMDLKIAILMGDAPGVERVLAAGADRQATSAAGSVVHVAAAHGSVGVLRLLWEDARVISALSAPGPG